MKTVQDYLDLGLVFVDSDKLLSVSNDNDSKEVCMSGLCIAHQRYCDGFRGGNAIFFYPSEWAPSSFSWRNNDGFKPEYKGQIEVCLDNAIELSCTRAKWEVWSSGYLNSVAKWRPVVMQSDDARDKSRHSFVTAIGIDITKFTVKEEKPKTTTTVNIEGRDYLIAAHKPTVSPKEDKPMKPVYTAEMHAKCELPTVDSKVTVCIEEAGFALDGDDSKFEGKTVTVKAVFINKEGKKIVAIENDKGNCTCYIIECIKPIIKTIKVNGFDVPAPMSEAPENRRMVYLAHAAHLDFNLDFTWQGGDTSVSWLSRGLIHSTKSAAIAHAKAMLGINPDPTRGGDGYDRNVLGQNNEGDEL